jgi:hypothetical protein
LARRCVRVADRRLVSTPLDAMSGQVSP